MDKSWLVETDNGDRVLIVEGDSSVGDEALALGYDACNDLNLQEASQAYRMLYKKLRNIKGGQEDDRIVRVLLGDSNSTITSGGGHQITLRDRIDILNDVDIFIDAKVPLINEIVNWSKRILENEDHNKIVFDTSNSKYYNTLVEILAKHNIDIVDALPQHLTYPRIVYQKTTSDTLNTIRSLVFADVIPTEKCCALLDKKHGLDQIKDISEEIGSPVSYICSSLIYDNLYYDVRSKIRSGMCNDEIQSMLDKKFENVLGDSK
eukprot:TRINITY_DN8337_c0_g1_i2.p1 TRINITY_DN8337_c0_g1~~TRINITY_DN8337_c0_g1_i2.p1  ORF type:complete len:263 (-),score=55.54 TRINITY_DN8337_c0_g1_i2:34-822(-)